MVSESPLLLVLDLTGTFAFAVNGALTALRLARLDIVGVITLGIITAIGGGIIRDVLIDSLPPATSPSSGRPVAGRDALDDDPAAGHPADGRLLG